jgi:signal transduction histidine kinase
MGDQPEPRIWIGERTQDGRQVLFVKDNGMGISEPHRERVFGLFEKLDVSSEGHGIGLALVKRIVELHGGRVWVESEGRGRGSTFCFTLAAAPDAPKAIAT